MLPSAPYLLRRPQPKIVSAAAWAGPTTNLTHRWPMDNANVSGTTVSDVIGTLHGTAGSGVSSTTGPSGSNTARAFDGTNNSYVTLASSPIPLFQTAFGIGHWVNVTDINASSGDGAGNQTFLNFYDGTIALKPCNDAGKAAIDSSWLESTAIQLASATWASVFVTSNSNGSTLKLYINGSLVASGAPAGSATGTNNVFGARDPGSSLHRGMIGALAGVCTYTGEPSAGTVLQWHNAGSS